MTISRKVKKNGNKVQDSPYIAKNTGIQLTLSLPRIVSKDKFKTDDFYYYVFCDPITGHGIFRFDSNINTMNTGTPKIVEITDGEPMDLIETSNLDDNLLINDEEARDVLGKPNTGDKIPDSGKDPVDMLESHTTDCKNKTDLILNYNFEDKMEVPSSEEPKINMFNFSYPILIDTDNNKSMKHDTGTNYTESDVHIALTFNLSTPDKGKKTYDQNMHAKKEILIPNDDIGTIKQKISKSWVFSKAFDKYDSLKCNEAINEIAKSETKKNNCNFCWVFQHLKECEYCKDSTHKAVKVTDKQNMEKDILDHTKENKEKSMKKEIETDSLIDTNVRMHNKTVEFEKDGKGHEIGKSWQCNVCLTNNNTNRSTCNCCESNKYTENGNCKVTFGKNKTFFDTTQPEKHKKEYNFDKETNIPNIGEGTVTTVHSLLIEEEWKMDIKSGNNEDKIEKQIANIKNINTIQSMDVETDTFCYQLDKKVEIKDDEMDVEDIPSIPDIVQNFISSPVKTLTTNIVPYVGHTPGADWMSPSTDTSWRTSSSSSPYVGTNIQFNMGTTPHEKGARKMIRAVRTIPKAFHK